MKNSLRQDPCHNAAEQETETEFINTDPVFLKASDPVLEINILRTSNCYNCFDHSQLVMVHSDLFA